MECKKKHKNISLEHNPDPKPPVYENFIFGLWYLGYVPGFVTCPPLFGGFAMALDLMIIHLWNAMFKGGIHREPWQLTWNLDEPYFLMGRLSSISTKNMAMENHHGLRGDTSTQMVFPIVMLVFKGVKHQSRLPQRLAKGHHVRYLETPFAARPHDCYDVVICLLKSTGFVGPPDKELSHSLDRGWKEKKRTQNWLFHVLLLLYQEGFFSLSLTCLVPIQTIILAITHPPPIQIDRGDTFGGSIGSGKSSTKSCVNTGGEVVRFGDLLRAALMIFVLFTYKKIEFVCKKSFVKSRD